MLDEVIIFKTQNSKLPKISGIYGIRNLVNNKIYIGSSKNIRNRISDHKYSLNKNIHPNDYLQKSWNKYKINNFIFFIIEPCDQVDLFDKEIYYINYYKSLNMNLGYNLKAVVRDLEYSKSSIIMRSKISKSKIKYNKENPLTHCRRGHLFTEETVLKRKDGSKTCKICCKIYYKKRNLEEKNKRHSEFIKKDTCRNGHLICKENVSIHKGGKRVCLACKRNKYKKVEKRNTCRRGHIINEENTYMYKNRPQCRVCKRMQDSYINRNRKKKKE